MTGQLDAFEQWLARLENRHDELANEFHQHAQQSVHTSFVEVVAEIRSDLRVLQARWLQVGGAVIALLITILLSLLGVLWTLTRPISPPQSTVVVSRPTCSQFASQAEAQAFYRGNPSIGVVLDGDRDGLACEDSPGPFDHLIVSP